MDPKQPPPPPPAPGHTLFHPSPPCTPDGFERNKFGGVGKEKSAETKTRLDQQMQPCDPILGRRAPTLRTLTEPHLDRSKVVRMESAGLWIDIGRSILAAFAVLSPLPGGGRRCL